MSTEQTSKTPAESIALPNLVEMVTASTRYLGALSDLTDEEAAGPSLLLGWTRAHVITHLARNADALCNLLHWAETGEVHYMYASRETRDADIAAGADRSAHDLRVDASASAGRLIQAVNELDVRHENAQVARRPGDATFPAKEVPTHRWVELQVHEADLDHGYTAADWSPRFCDVLLSLVVPDRAHGPSMTLRATDTSGVWQYGGAAGQPGAGPTIEGRACDLAWWAVGRGDGSGLSSDAGDLPQLSPWR